MRRRISKIPLPQGDAMTQNSETTPETEIKEGARASLPPAAQRALAEAEERRKKAKELDLPPELGGRDGPEPVRYGDWEKKGIAVDF